MLRQREQEAIKRLVAPFRDVGRGEWLWRRGADPPDFIIENRGTREIVAVEHTTFVWPPGSATFD